MRRLTILSISCLLLSSSSYAEKPTTVALQGINNFKRLINKQETKAEYESKKLQGLSRLGFQSKNEVSSATLDEPVQQYMVRLDNLQRYRAGIDQPASLLTAVDSYIYPMMSNKVAKASIFIEKSAVVGYGSPRLTQSLTVTRQQVMKQTRLPVDAFFLVQIPALNLEFLGHYKSLKLVNESLRIATPRRELTPVLATPIRPGLPQLTPIRQLMLTPIRHLKIKNSDRPNDFIQLTQGQPLAAADVFSKIYNAAKNLDVSVPH